MTRLKSDSSRRLPRLRIIGRTRRYERILAQRVYISSMGQQSDGSIEGWTHASCYSTARLMVATVQFDPPHAYDKMTSTANAPLAIQRLAG